MNLHTLVSTSRRIAETSRRLEKIGLLAELLRHTDAEEIPLVIAYLSGNLRQGKIGIGYATLCGPLAAAPVAAPTLTLAEVDTAFARVAATTGPGSTPVRVRFLATLLARATEEERNFLVRLVLGELRQGSLEGIMAEAIARASGSAIEKVRRALMVSGDLTAVGRLALEAGENGFGPTPDPPLPASRAHARPNG